MPLRHSGRNTNMRLTLSGKNWQVLQIGTVVDYGESECEER